MADVDRYGRTRMDLHHEWEQYMKWAHPCWDDARNCISCGCTVEGPCVSHGRYYRTPMFDLTALAAARSREQELREKLWGNRDA